MNAQSTPVRRKNLRSQLDPFSEITPIKRCRTLPKHITNGINETSHKNDRFNAKSQRQRFSLRKYNEREKSLDPDNVSAASSNQDAVKCPAVQFGTSLSSDIQEIKELFKDSFGDTGCFLSDDLFSANESSAKLLNSGNNSLGNQLKSKKNESCSSKGDDVELGKSKSGVGGNEKINEVLTASDVMRWTDQTFLQKDHNSINLSNQIKKKLLENAENTEVVKSQTSGWTQLNASAVLRAEEEILNCQELGPFYGLPTRVQELYKELKGINELYAWQQECLNLEGVKLRQNLVYSLPTSGGKTLVAELLILKEILCYKRNVLFILPYVSIVQEKIKDFSQFAVDLGFLVEEYAAGKGIIPPKKRRRKNSLLIATIEKALIVVNSLIECKRLSEFGMIVVDELHMLSEEGRGAVLESLLTQVLFCREKIQIIGMTATIGNLEEVARFLRAESYVCNFRPVSLTEYVQCEKKIYSIEWTSDEVVKEVRTLKTPLQDVDGIAQLVLEVIPKESVLIFCASRKNCENVALLLSRTLPKHLMSVKEDEKKSLYRALVTESNDQICPVLKKTLPFGLAYHHSGLTAGERKLLEESFRDGTLSVICCTSTLAVGVNLPAKRVILRSPYVGKDFITLSKYKQMIGRAGRSGFGSEGESFLICQTSDMDKVKKLLRSHMDDTTSKVDVETCKDLVLSSVGLGTATTRKALRELLTCSMLHVQAGKLKADTKKMADICISSLYKQGALKVKNSQGSLDASNSKLDLNVTMAKKSLKITNESQLSISRLGRAAMKGGLSLEKAHELYSDLIKAQSSLVLLTNLHLLYLITPPDIVAQIKPDYSVYFNAYMQLNSNEVHTAKIIGITEFAMSKLAMGIKPKTVQETIVNRFYVSLMLNELWKQQTVWDVATIFQLPRGLVQTLMTSAATFANSVLRFCEELEEFWSFKTLFTDFAPRLAHCCSSELLPLMDLPAVKRGRAKQLYEAGFKTLQILAGSNPGDLVRSVDHLSAKVASQIVAAAKLLLMEKAENLKEEAEDVLEGLAEKSAPKDI